MLTSTGNRPAAPRPNGSRRGRPRLVAVAMIAVLMLVAPLPVRGAARPGSGGDGEAQSLPTTSILLLVTVVGGGGLAAMHVSLLVTRVEASLNREAIAWMLSLCGLAMLAAQLFHTRVPWLVTAPRLLVCLTLALLAAALFVFPYASSMIGIAGLIVAAGWSSASLRLVTSFWISGPTLPSGWKLGLQHAAASIGQALAPLAIALADPGEQSLILIGIGWMSILLLVALPLVWRRRPGSTNATV